MKEKRFFGQRPPEIKEANFPGKLFVIEGADGSGRSSQIALITRWLEANGHAVRHVGLRRSNLVSEELEDAKHGNVLTRTTLSLFYATDFFDQLINNIVPALRAGFIVIADRYVYTLMARDLVRGADRDWVRNLYSPALVPDAIFYLRVSSQRLVERNLEKNSTLDYWESGMDMGLSRELFDSFFKYQKLLQREFQQMQKEYKFEMINANRRIEKVQPDLRRALARQLSLRPEEPEVSEPKHPLIP